MSDSEFEVSRAALRERYSSPPATSTSDTTSEVCVFVFAFDSPSNCSI